MTTARAIDRLHAKVFAQKEKVPALYGNVDFTVIPERFTVDPHAVTALPPKYADGRAALLADKERVELIRAYTMMGDVVADAYASLMPKLGFRKLVDLLTKACDEGIDAIDDAPPELAAFIADMERKPEWLDMAQVEEGARIDRNRTAHLAPLIIRGAFIATFMNQYAALPMAITNTLSSSTAARRVKETATFFSTSVLPGALERHGPGFKSAAMVRLMHSMVRFNVLHRPKDWNVEVYGIPIPQVDQMPAGLIAIFLLSYDILSKGRTWFTPSERARVELARYRCFLLGLPEDLLADTPQGIVDLMTARNGTLRQAYDDATCGALLRATMAADLEQGTGLRDRIHSFVERRFSKFFFVQNFMGGDRAKARAIGVDLGAGDIAISMVALARSMVQTGLYKLGARIPGLAPLLDRRLVKKIKQQLAKNGHAEFTTDASNYRPQQRAAA